MDRGSTDKRKAERYNLQTSSSPSTPRHPTLTHLTHNDNNNAKPAKHHHQHHPHRPPLPARLLLPPVLHAAAHPRHAPRAVHEMGRVDPALLPPPPAVEAVARRRPRLGPLLQRKDRPPARARRRQGRAGVDAGPAGEGGVDLRGEGRRRRWRQ